ncbi:MAG: hypothetical protein IJI14_11980 [Anaerolineaceae bacterium]|nr:hypothetical protein [Anaerolineaceae bacterium]
MSRWFIPNPASVSPGVMAAQVTPPGVGLRLQASVLSERMSEFFFPNSEPPVFFSCTREGLLQMSVEWFSDRSIFMIINGPMSQEWYDIADDCHGKVAIFDTAYTSDIDIKALSLELKKEKFDILMFVETDVFTGASVNAAAICEEFRAQSPDGLVVTEISGCIFCGFDEAIAGLADICLCGSEMAMGLPPGLGMAVMNTRAHTRLLAHNVMNGRYFNYPRKTVSRSTSALDVPIYPLFNALNEQIDSILSEGMPARVERMKNVYSWINNWIASRGFRILGPAESRALNCTSFVLSEGINAQDVADHAAQYGVYVMKGIGQMPENSLIIYHGNDITTEDAGALIRVLERFLNDYDTRRRNIPQYQRPQEQKV